MAPQTPKPPILATAPMIDWTDRHCLYLFSILAPHATLYTEMIVDKAIIFGSKEGLLRHDLPTSQQVILQLGGSKPDEMAKAIQQAEAYNYSGYNINVGCPSNRVQAGAFGACLMATPQVVADCFKVMQQQTNKPISIKTRLGIDDQNDTAFLYKFIETTAMAGCQSYTIHARKAWLKGLSPKQNREIPPLEYDRVYKLKQDFPELHITINGGIDSIEASQQHLQQVDAIMLGRLAYQQPYELAKIHSTLFQHPLLTRAEVLERFITYMDKQFKIDPSLPLHIITKSLVGLFHDQPNAKQWRRFLGQKMGFDEFSERVIEWL